MLSFKYPWHAVPITASIVPNGFTLTLREQTNPPGDNVLKTVQEL